ncbi:MAG: type I restriction-modification system endonuclease [Alphaproteobacteria bacterium]|nr:type I restriction-modification system endonuclease [Alphaproteobacteria bacterium]
MTLQSPNFAFLAEHHPLLLRYAAAAERYVFSDPNTALIKLRQFAEVLAQELCAATGAWTAPELSLLELLNTLWDRGALSPETSQLLHGLRKAGNEAVHAHQGTRKQALTQLRMARELAVWFHRAFGDAPGFQPGPFLPPPDPAAAEAGLSAELERLRAELTAERAATAQAQASAEDAASERVRLEAEARAAFEELEVALALAEESAEALEVERARFKAQLAATQARAVASPEEQEAALARVRAANLQVRLSEADTREIIDAQLREAGWEADTQVLRWSRGVRPVKGRAIAIAEVPTESGFADYVLFSGLTALGVVEAKRRRRSARSALEQSQRYSAGLRPGPGVELAPGAPWDGLHVPFLFASNGRPFLRQLLDESGIWFRDARRPTNQARALEGWYSPEGLADLLRVDVDAAEARLAAEPTDYLGLRDYQLEAIRAVETGVAQGRRALLLAMATGTGKTRTSIGLIYRLVKSGRFRRVLFLVDRTSLGEQAADAFKDVRLENLQSFAEIYDVKELGDLTPGRDTRLHFATVQGMVRRLLYAGPGADPLPVDTYDCVIVDECHRGYSLDRELSDTELSFRSEADYISKYRRVLDHFDAVKVGLTATPALHTTEIFGEPIYRYSYRQAVIDGFLVDHEPPIRIITQLALEGISWEAGEEVERLVVETGEVERHLLPDEVAVEIDKFNKLVITEPFNRVVCEALAEHIDPVLPGKTLIFAASDRHADMVVRLLTEAFTARYGALHNRTVLKITGAADKPSQRIRELKNERDPRVAVTVDLLTTGIDVPAITNLVFLRRVRSRILYEQMMGRATRLCPNLYGDGDHKESFRVFDAVDLYAALLPHTDIKPVVVSPDISFRQLARELSQASDPEVARQVLDQLRAKLHSRARRMGRTGRESFATVAGCTPEELVQTLAASSPAEARAFFAARPKLPELLDLAKGSYGARLLISHHPDTLSDVVRGYGSTQRPEDYLESFGDWLEENLNALPALVAVTQRPRELTRADLKELLLALDGAGFSEAHLRVAWRETTNQDIAATILGYIRQQALGDPLEPYERRVSRALERVLSSRAWTRPQRQWLTRIAKQIEKNTVVDREALDSGQFRAQAGGFERLNRVFNGELEAVVGELADAVWGDAG